MLEDNLTIEEKRKCIGYVWKQTELKALYGVDTYRRPEDETLAFEPTEYLGRRLIRNNKWRFSYVAHHWIGLIHAMNSSPTEPPWSAIVEIPEDQYASLRSAPDPALLAGIVLISANKRAKVKSIICIPPE